MRSFFSAIGAVRERIKPGLRDGIDGFGLYIAITLLFCLIAAAHDGVAKRQRAFDDQRWWVQIYKSLGGQ